jgi:hypothetical protein
MPTQDDIAAQQALLRAHRRTLGVLLEQQAAIGAAFAPPALAGGIAEAREAIARVKAVLRGWGVSAEDLPDDEKPAAATGAPNSPQTLPAGTSAGGDMIVGSVGAGAQGIAIGKNIRQALSGGQSAQEEDRRAIDELLARLDRELAANIGQIEHATAQMAAGYLRLLGGELTKAGDRAAPSASTVTLVGDWLLDNVSPLRAALAALFTAPASRRALARADAPLDTWLDRRFGS